MQRVMGRGPVLLAWTVRVRTGASWGAERDIWGVDVLRVTMRCELSRGVAGSVDAMVRLWLYCGTMNFWLK